MALNENLYLTLQDVTDRLQTNSDLPSYTTVMTSAILGAQTQVESLLGSKLSLKTWTNVLFQLDSDAFSGIQPGGVFRLELPSGFVRNDPDNYPITINFGTTWLLPDTAVADPTLYQVDYERGYILMDAITYCDAFVQVTFTSGFLPSSIPTPPVNNTPANWSSVVEYEPGNGVIWTDSQVYVCLVQNTNQPPFTGPTFNSTDWALVVFGPEQLPNEIYEAIISMVPAIFDNSQVTNRNSEAESQARKNADRVLLLCRSFVRFKGFSIRAMIK